MCHLHRPESHWKILWIQATARIFLDALASLRPHRPRIAIDNLRIQTWILRLSPDSFWIAKITTESISENWDCVNIIEDYHVMSCHVNLKFHVQQCKKQKILIGGSGFFFKKCCKRGGNKYGSMLDNFLRKKLNQIW